MAQAEKEPSIKLVEEESSSSTEVDASFKFNVDAPEFVPTLQVQQQQQPQQQPVLGYYIHPCFHLLGGAGVGGGSEWFYLGQQQLGPFIPNSTNLALPNTPKNFLHDDLRQKIVKQVEYQFSDMSLLSSDTLTKHMNKDPEGYVPISVISSSKKIKALVTSNILLCQALRTSSKLVVSSDGKKIRRKNLFTDRDKEDLQSRVVVADNLPEDHSYPNLEKVFGVAGSVKNIRICHPNESNGSISKGDVLISNKLTALVEYENIEQAEKAVEKLNDEMNWRTGLRVRLLLRRSPRSVMRNRKNDYDHFDVNSEEDEAPPTCESLDNSPHHQSNKTPESSTESNPTTDRVNVEDNNSSGSKKGGWNRGRGKSRGRAQSHNSLGPGLVATVSPQTSGCSSVQPEAASLKQTPLLGPRMPDGTRGFTMGRGKPKQAWWYKMGVGEEQTSGFLSGFEAAGRYSPNPKSSSSSSWTGLDGFK